MYRTVFAAVAALLTFGTAYQDDGNPLRQSLPNPREAAEAADVQLPNPQVAGVENLIKTLQNVLAERDRQNEDLQKTFNDLQNTVSSFESAVGSIQALNEKVEKVALVAVSATENDTALAARVEALEKTVQELQRELEKHKAEQATQQEAAKATSPAPTTASQPAGNYPSVGGSPVASGGSTGSYKTASGGSTGSYQQNTLASGGSTGNYASSVGSVSGGCTGSYTSRGIATSRGYTTTAVGYEPLVMVQGGCYDEFGNAIPVSSQTFCYDEFGNQIPCNPASVSGLNGFVSSPGQAVYCVDEFGNQVPCDNTAAQGVSSKRVAGPLRRWLQNRRGG